TPLPLLRMPGATSGMRSASCLRGSGTSSHGVSPLSGTHTAFVRRRPRCARERDHPPYRSCAIVWEAVRRFAEPPQVAAPTGVVVATIAIAVNLVSAWLLRGGEHDLNVQGAFIHSVRRSSTFSSGSNTQSASVYEVALNAALTSNTSASRSTTAS